MNAINNLFELEINRRVKFSLKDLMDERNLSIQKVHERTGISRNTISKFYNGNDKGIKFETLNKLLIGLRISLSDLFRL
ncbi:helix-turn-helix domain-containing protein [Paucilactobacillus sp. N302-9]